MRPVLLTLAYLLALGFGLFQMFRPTWLSGFARMQTERGDGMLNHYVLEHTWQSLVNPAYCGTLFSPPCFYPEPATLWYSEHLLGVAPLYWGLRLVAGPETAYQVWQIVLAALNFVAFAAVFRWLRCPHLVALLGGYLWGFALVHIDQVKHQQMIARFWVPLALYHATLFVFALRPGRRAAPVTGGTGLGPGVGTVPPSGAVGSAGAVGARTPVEEAAVATRTPLYHLAAMLGAILLQAVSCVYTGWFLAVGLASFLPVAVLLRPGGLRGLLRFAWEEGWRLGLVLGLWLAVVVGAFVPYLVVNWGITRTYEECLGLMPTTSAWLTGLPGTPWDETMRPWRSPVTEECRLFCGFGVYALMVLAAVVLAVRLLTTGRGPEQAVQAAALFTAVLWVVLTWSDDSPQAASLWQYVRFCPGGLAIRCVSRVYITVYAFGLFGALLGLSRLTDRLRPNWRAAVLLVATVVCGIEQQGYEPPSFEKTAFYPVADRVAEQLRRGDAGYVVPRYDDGHGETLQGIPGQVLAMWAGLRANVPVVNGYSGRLPAGGRYPPYGVEVSDDMLRTWLEGRFRGRLVVIVPDDPTATRILVID